MKKFLLTAMVLALVAPALPAAPPQAPSHDYAAIKLQTDIFESVLNTAIRQRYTGNFMMLSPAKGTYLEGYGVVFTLEVNTATMRYITPFASAPYSAQEIKDAKAQKIARTKEMEELIKTLIRGNGAGLSFLKPEENVAVVVHLFNVTEHKELPTQLVVSAKKQSLDKLTAVLY